MNYNYIMSAINSVYHRIFLFDEANSILDAISILMNWQAQQSC